MTVARYRQCASCNRLMPRIQERCDCGERFSGKEKKFKVCPACACVLKDRRLRCDCGLLFIFRGFLDKQAVPSSHVSENGPHIEKKSIDPIDLAKVILGTIILIFIISYSYDSGYERAESKHETDYSVGYDEGYGRGYDDGYDSGLDLGRSDGYGDGYGDGRSDGYNLGREDGYDEGYYDGRIFEKRTSQNEGTTAAEQQKASDFLRALADQQEAERQQREAQNGSGN